jgi:hypothetical protein
MEVEVMVARVTSNKYVRYLKLKTHVRFVWNCANGQQEIARQFGKLTRADYTKVGGTSWGKRRVRYMTLREIVQQPNKHVIVYFDHIRQFQSSDLNKYTRMRHAVGRYEPLEPNGTRVDICISSMRGEQFAGCLPDYIVVKGQTWEQWEGREQLLWRLQRAGGELVYDE